VYPSAFFYAHKLARNKFRILRIQHPPPCAMYSHNTQEGQDGLAGVSGDVNLTVGHAAQLNAAASA
jgi:hypothetical protein